MQYDLYQILIPALSIPVLLFAYWRIHLKLLKRYASPLLGKIEVWQKYNKERVLTINSYVQGISINDPSIKNSYWYSVARQTIKHCQDINYPKILMLGLGANTISSLINNLNPKCQLTIVEFDSQIIQACQDYFNLEKINNLKLIQTDVYKLADSEAPRPHGQDIFSPLLRRERNPSEAEKSSHSSASLHALHRGLRQDERSRFSAKGDNNYFKEPFDVIIVDVFTGNPPYISLKSNQSSFIEKLLPWLKKDGLMIFNRPAHTETVRQDGQELEIYLKTLFKETEIIDIKDPRGFRNFVITASMKR